MYKDKQKQNECCRLAMRRLRANRRANGIKIGHVFHPKPLTLEDAQKKLRHVAAKIAAWETDRLNYKYSDRRSLYINSYICAYRKKMVKLNEYIQEKYGVSYFMP